MRHVKKRLFWKLGLGFLGMSFGIPSANAAFDAYSTIQAESYSSNLGVCKYSSYISCGDNGDWLRFDAVNFGSTGAARVEIRLALQRSKAGLPIEIRLGSAQGTLIGTLSAASTGSASTYAVQSVAVSRVTGQQTVFVRFPGSQFVDRVDWIRFVQATTAPTPTPVPATPTPAPTPVATPPPATPTPTPPPTASCTLQSSGPIVVSRNGQIIENLKIVSTTSSPAITVKGFSDVIIRNVAIEHRNGMGIEFANAPRLRIENVSVLHTGAPAKGANPNDELINIGGENSADVVMRNVRLEKGSTGIYMLNSPRAKLSLIEGHDFRGPFPRGQLVQFDKSHDSVLEDFSNENPQSTSWPEDNISVFNSSNVTVRRGLLQGNNSPSGVGVMYEQIDSSVSGGLVEDVDAVGQGNGCFSGLPARNVTFNRANCVANICTDQGRGKPMSNGLAYAGDPDGSSNLKILSSKYDRLCNPSNLIWEDDVFSTIQLSSASVVPRAPIRVKLCWK